MFVIDLVQSWLTLVFFGAILVAAVFALVDVLRRPAAAYLAAGKRTKNFWLIGLIVAVVVAFIALPVGSGGGGGLFSMLAMGSAVMALVYLVDVRPAVMRHRRKGPGSSRGGW